MTDEPLYSDDGAPLWKEHPKFCIKDQENPAEPNVDLAAVRLRNTQGVLLYPLDLSLADTNVRVLPGLPVFIIGYPFGQSGPAWFPIWKTGHIASDADAYWSPRYFLIDATTRSGMSGSPVVFRSLGVYQSAEGAPMSGTVTRLMGVYSGRIHKNVEVGRVWKPELIPELIDG